jgi:hypothetical protein
MLESPETTRALELVSSAKAMLEQANTVDEIHDAYTFATTAKTILQARADARDAFLAAAETQLRAERKLGDWLAKQPKAKGGRPTTETGDTVSLVSEAPSLADLGISKQDSSRWQKLAAVKASAFEAYVSVTLKDGKPPTAAGARRLVIPGSTIKRRRRPGAGRRLSLRETWGISSPEERAALVDAMGFVSLAKLSSITAERNADPEFAAMRGAQRAVLVAMPSRAQRMLEFVLDGGELALLRLGLDLSATSEQLKTAYKAASLQAHPDRAGGSTEKFMAVTAAYEKVKTFLET